MLARHISVRYKSEFYRNGWKDRAGFGTDALPTLCCKGTQGIFKNMHTSL